MPTFCACEEGPACGRHSSSMGGSGWWTEGIPCPTNHTLFDGHGTEHAYVCASMYFYLCICVYVCVCGCVRVHTHMGICVWVCLYICVFMCVHMHVSTYVARAFVCPCGDVYICMCVNVSVCV